MPKVISPKVKKTVEEIKKEKCVNEITAILDKYGFSLAVTGFTLMPK